MFLGPAVDWLLLHISRNDGHVTCTETQQLLPFQKKSARLSPSCYICECGHKNLLRTIYHNSIISVINWIPFFYFDIFTNRSQAASCVCAFPALFKSDWNVLECDVTVHRGFREPLKHCLPLRYTRTGTLWTWKSRVFRELGSIHICHLLLCISSSAPLLRQCNRVSLSCFLQTNIRACWYWWLISQRPSSLLEINELPVTC